MKRVDFLITVFLTTMMSVSAILVQSCSASKDSVRPEVPVQPTVKPKQDSVVSIKSLSVIDNTPKVLVGSRGIDEAFPCVSADGNKLVYQRREVSGNWQIWSFDLVTGDNKLVYKDDANLESPVYSPDGNKIVFTGDKNGIRYKNGSRGRDLFIMDADGNNVKKITDSKSDNWHPVFASGGDKIYFASNRNDSEQKYYDENSAVFSYDLTTNKTDEILTMIQYKNNPSLSYDGKFLLFTNKDNKLEMVNSDTGLNGKVISDAESISGGGFFSSDGKKIFFYNFKNGRYEIISYTPENGLSETVVSDLSNSRGTFVRDNSLYFHSNQKSDYDIYVKNLK